MIDSDIRRTIDGNPTAHLATLMPDGSPHSVPVWVGMRGDRIAIQTGPGSQKARNLRRDPRVAISLTPPDDPFVSIYLRAGWSSGWTATTPGRSSTSWRRSTSAPRIRGTRSASSPWSR